MDFVKQKLHILHTTRSDINEHLPVLWRYAIECESIIELGTRGCVSSWAFASGLLLNNKKNKQLLLNDISPCDIEELMSATKDLDIEISHEWKNDLDLDIRNNVDLTFIDTWHVYGQLKRELDKFSKVTNKYIIMHDTTVDEIHGETIRWMGGYETAVKQSSDTGIPVEEIMKGLWPAVEEFLSNNASWRLKKKYTNNNGLTILERTEHM